MNLKNYKHEIGETWIDDAGNYCTVRENGTIRVATVNHEPSKTIQSEKDSCDINKILAKFKSTGLMTNVRQDKPLYGDFTNVVDYQTAVIQAQAAEESFMSLPAALRKRFNNDPGELIAFVENSENRSEAIKLGLIPNVENVESVKADDKKEADPSST